MATWKGTHGTDVAEEHVVRAATLAHGGCFRFLCPDNPPLKLPGQDSDCHNPYAGNGQAIHQDRLSHALPTSQTEDSDLALIVGLWDRLADEIKQRLIEMVRANMPTESTERTSNSGG